MRRSYPTGAITRVRTAVTSKLKRNITSKPSHWWTVMSNATHERSANVYKRTGGSVSGSNPWGHPYHSTANNVPLSSLVDSFRATIWYAPIRRCLGFTKRGSWYESSNHKEQKDATNAKVRAFYTPLPPTVAVAIPWVVYRSVAKRSQFVQPAHATLCAVA